MRPEHGWDAPSMTEVSVTHSIWAAPGKTGLDLNPPYCWKCAPKCQVRIISLRAPDEGPFLKVQVVSWFMTSRGGGRGRRSPCHDASRTALTCEAACSAAQPNAEKTGALLKTILVWDIPLCLFLHNTFKGHSYNAGTRMGNALSQTSCCQSKK